MDIEKKKCCTIIEATSAKKAKEQLQEKILGAKATTAWLIDKFPPQIL